MTTVEGHCDRAILLEGGEIVEAGDPGDVARRYLQLNFEHRRAGGRVRGRPLQPAASRRPSSSRRGSSAPDGEPVDQLRAGQPIRLEATIEAVGADRAPDLRLPGR